MALTLDYNVELFPLEAGKSITLALASSLSRGGPQGADADGDEADREKDRDVWRPDGKGRRGLEEDYDYVMYGKVRAENFTSLRCLLIIHESGLQIRR
jgi:hypothetical protein